MSVDKFHNRDNDYLNWVKAHRTGYVINVYQSRRGVAKLHSAACETIVSKPPFTVPYIKICSTVLSDLDQWALGHPRIDLSRCGTCQPPGHIASSQHSPSATTALPTAVGAGTEQDTMAKHEWEIDGPDAEKRWVRLWTDRYIPYERRTDEQQAAREALRLAVRSLAAETGEILHASYAGFKPDGMDVENLVLYNIDDTVGGCFSPGTRHGVRVEMANVLRGNAPSGRPHAFSYEYGLTSPDSSFSHWRLTRPLVHFADTDLGAFPSGKRLEQVWLAIHRTKGTRVTPNPISATERFAVRLVLNCPRSQQAGPHPGLVKALIDGTVAAFQCHRDDASVEEIASRLARITGERTGLIKQLLLDGSHAVLGAADKLVYLRGPGVQWNPADHLVVAAQVVCRQSPGTDWSLSGEIHVVESVS